MKKLILLFIISLSSLASTYIPKSKLGKDTTGMVLELNKAKCEERYSESCINISETGNYEYLELQEFQEVEGNSISCLTGCDEEFEKLTCDEGFEKRRGLVSVYCYKAILEKVVINEAKKATYDQLMFAKKLDAESMAIVMANMECGKKTIARMTLLNASKDLSESEVSTFVSTYSDIKQLLETGALDTAKLLIGQVVADGEITLESDKLALIAEINGCQQ